MVTSQQSITVETKVVSDSPKNSIVGFDDLYMNFARVILNILLILLIKLF